MHDVIEARRGDPRQAVLDLEAPDPAGRQQADRAGMSRARAGGACPPGHSGHRPRSRAGMSKPGSGGICPPTWTLRPGARSHSQAGQGYGAHALLDTQARGPQQGRPEHVDYEGSDQWASPGVDGLGYNRA